MALATAGSVLGTVSVSSADSTPSLALEPAPAGDSAFAVERAGIHGHWLVSARLAGDYASGPLVLRNAAQDIDRVVGRQVWTHALASLSLAYRFLISLDVPFLIDEVGDVAPRSGATAPRPSGDTTVGDLRLGVRAKIVGTPSDAQDSAELALSIWGWLPTAGAGYAGDDALRIRAALVAEGASQRLYWAVNAGIKARPSEKLPGLLPTRIGTSLTSGIAAGFFADRGRAVALGVEALADLPIADGARLFDPRATAAHVFLTGHYRIANGPFELGAAMGPGVGQGAGSDDFRVLALMGFSPQRTAPPPDDDEDGIPDKVDACIDVRGIPSADPMLHGCPAAPTDSDGDGIPDHHDACPAVPGKPTYAPSTHGCPASVDGDGDGVPDSVDACPREPGERPPAGNGCPGARAGAAQLAEQAIVLGQQVQFETGSAVLRSESDPVLGEVARIMVEHPEIELVEVQGHTDEQGTPERNRQLGQERAASVIQWLSLHDVPRHRLSAKGYGADRPIADNTDEGGRQKNRRVEFRILKKKPSDSRPSPRGETQKVQP